MTLRATAVWLSLTVAAGTALYVVKHEVGGLEDRLTAIDDQVQKDRAAIHVLHAEWAYLTRPERLAALVKNHLDLVTPRPSQIVTSIDQIPLAPPAAAPDALNAPFRPMKTARAAP